MLWQLRIFIESQTIGRIDCETMFQGRHFTPDGHLVGSLGECLAAYYYGLELLPASSAGADAIKDGLRIEIKATQGSRVGLRSAPDHLLVLKLDRTGGFVEIYNGSGWTVWQRLKDRPRPSNGQYQISLASLKALMQEVPEHSGIKLEVSSP